MWKGQPCDDVHWFMEELTSRIVAKTGNPMDRYHLGKILLQSFRDAPDFILHIDGGTGKQDTFRSALERSIRCATSLKNLGLKVNDTIAVMGPNNIDLPITIYAGTYLGVAVAGLDMSLVANEYRGLFQQCPPKAVFCPSISVNHVNKALEDLDLKSSIITFDKIQDYMSFDEFLDKYADNILFDEFQPNEIDPKETNLIIVPTSGTTGVPKLTELTHFNVAVCFPVTLKACQKFPTPIRLGLCISPIQWLTAQFFYFLSPITRFTRLQTSLPVNKDHVYDLINKYKPSFMIASPPFLTTIVKSSDRDKCDFRCFEHIIVSGSAVSVELQNILGELIPHVILQPCYGMTEASGYIFYAAEGSFNSCGRPMSHFKYKLVDPSTDDEILEADKPGELWLKGPSIFKGYYNNPEATAAAFSDGWLKTGDIFYRDIYFNFYFVDRLKLLLKYKNNQISPVELEGVISKHPGVLDVAVTGLVLNEEDGDLPVACVVPKKGSNVTAQDIKDLVKNELSDYKQLRGGVIFVDELPFTSTLKINRSKLKELVKNMQRIV